MTHNPKPMNARQNLPFEVEYAHLLQEGEKDFRDFFIRVGREYDAYQRQFFIDNPHIEYYWLAETPDEYPDWIRSVWHYIDKFYIPDFDFLLGLPESDSEQKQASSEEKEDAA
jgi:hypothetical protein